MTGIRFLGSQVLFLLPLLTVLVLGQRQVNQACILTTGTPGRCIRLEDCTEIAKLANRNVNYPWEMQRIKAVLGACESDENSSDPIVCCESPTLSPGRRTVVTTTVASIPITRKPTRARATTISTTVRTQTTIKYDHFRDVLPPYCGKKNQLGNNVFYGTEDVMNDHAWAVYLEIEKPKNNMTITGRCVGTLIQESFVLTAAHCLHNLAEEKIKLFFGDIKISKLELCLQVGECEERSAEEFIIHHGYDSHSRSNDIALIRLNEPIDILGDIVPACLPLNYTFDESLSNDRRVVSLGWGENEHGNMSDSKGIVILNVAPQVECGNFLKKRKRFNASMIFSVMCTIGEVEGQDVCNGDSGAPLLQLREDQYFVVGVVNFGPKCGTDIAPGVSVRVSEYIDWILLNLKRSKWLV